MSEKKKERNPDRAGKGGKVKIVIIACVVVIVVLVGAVVALAAKMLSSSGEQPQTAEKRNAVVNEDNVEEVLAELVESEKTASGHYRVTMNTTWKFKNGSSASSNAYVKNVAENTNDVYFDVTLADTDELIYSSPLIPLGSYLENITLDKDLDAGTYDCVCTYHLVDEEQNTLSTLRLTLTIEVEN